MEKITKKRKKQKKADGLGNPFTNPEEKMNIERENTDELKRRSFDILKITKQECFACDATTQTKKKQKNLCRIC